MNLLISLTVVSLYLLIPGVLAAQDGRSTLEAVFAAHGVTSGVTQAQVLFQGRLVTTGWGRGEESVFLVKTRGYDELRFEKLGSDGLLVLVHSRGFRWSQKGTARVQRYDARVSLNLPFMEAPSTGLLAYLLANLQRIEWIRVDQGSLNGKAVTTLVLQVPDPNPQRRTLGASYDRRYELLIDTVSKRLLGTSVILRPGRSETRANYRYDDYVTRGNILFASKVARSGGPLDGSKAGQVISTLLIDSIVLNQSFLDADFNHPR